MAHGLKTLDRSTLRTRASPATRSSPPKAASAASTRCWARRRAWSAWTDVCTGTTRVIETGTKPVYRLRTRGGYEVKLTADHRVWTENRGDVRAAELTKDDLVRLAQPRFGKETLEADVAEYAGLMLGAGQVVGRRGAAYHAEARATCW